MLPFECLRGIFCDPEIFYELICNPRTALSYARMYGEEGKTLDTIKLELRQILCEMASLPSDFDEKANLYSELGVASIQAMQLLMELEERYHVSLPDDEFVEARSLESLSMLIHKLRGI